MIELIKGLGPVKGLGSRKYTSMAIFLGFLLALPEYLEIPQESYSTYIICSICSGALVVSIFVISQGMVDTATVESASCKCHAPTKKSLEIELDENPVGSVNSEIVQEATMQDINFTPITTPEETRPMG